MLETTRLSTDSTHRAALQPLGPPLRVSVSTQMEPPAVTWPVYQTQRGEMTRSRKGFVG